MGIKIKNLQTGEFEKFNIPALKGEKGEPGEIESSEKVDYIGKQHSKLRDTMNANVDYIIKTAIGEFNYLDYEGQHITATNSIEGHAKSAILKGQTLVNHLPTISKTLTTGKGAWSTIFNGTINQALSGNTKYLFVNLSNVGVKLSVSVYGEAIGEKGVITNTTEKHTIFTTPNDTTFEKITVYLMETISTDMTWDRFMILPYQEGMENWDIPYFEGMQSVKMPVLTSTGKNLFNIEDNTHVLTKLENGNYRSIPFKSFNLPKFKEKTSYTLSFSVSEFHDGTYQFPEIIYTDGTKLVSYRADKTFNGNPAYILTSDSTKTISHIDFSYGINSVILEFVHFQIEEGSNSTSYEPFKSNILSASEDVELRGIGEVRDELNLLTGELTQRIGGVVLDGSENWYLYSKGIQDNVISFMLKNLDNKRYGVATCDKLKIFNTLTHGNGSNAEGIVSGTDTTGLTIYISKDKASNSEEFKQWLSQNPITVQYQLATESIKTVDLSDNVVYSYDGVTHYDCSSAEGSLVPTLSVKVPTDTQLTIQEQKATTQTLLIKNVDLQQSIKEVQAMNLAFNIALYNSFNSIREEVEDIKKHVSTNENLEGSF